MKHLGLVHIILILGAVTLLTGAAAGSNGLTAYQSLMPSPAEVGQMANVVVFLTYNGQNTIQAMVTPSLPPSVVANMGGQSLELYPGQTQQVSYPITGQQSGSYWIASVISYSEDGYPVNLRIESLFTATEPVSSPQPIQPGPGVQNPGDFPGPIGPGPVYPGSTDPYGPQQTGEEIPEDDLDLPSGKEVDERTDELAAGWQPNGPERSAGP